MLNYRKVLYYDLNYRLLYTDIFQIDKLFKIINQDQQMVLV